jgi:hypothetical protein
MEIPKDLKDGIWEYCRLNDITDLDAFIIMVLKQGFNIQKYGVTPFTVNNKEPEVVEKEIIREVEVIREVEKIVEVPFEVIREVEKIVEVVVTDNELIGRLKQETQELNEKINQLTLELGEEKNKSHDLTKNDLSMVKLLKQQVDNLKIELELEKNRNYQKPKIEVPKEIGPKNTGRDIINWVSKSEKEDSDLYGE